MRQNSLVDPVCGMSVADNSEHRATHKGEKYGFCSSSCQHKFLESPDRFLKPHSSKSDESVISGDLYTCPMHPEVMEKEPGACPKCGMALDSTEVPVSTTRTQYTCPMHPEIVQDEPGVCPKCGMALEAIAIAVEERNEELIDMTRRFWVSAVLAAPVFVLAMIADVFPALLPDGLSQKTVQWIEFVLATPVL